MKNFMCLVLCSCLLNVSGNPMKGRVNNFSLFCQSHPRPIVKTEDILQAMTMQSSFKEAENKIQAALSEDKSPGGAAVGLVYRDAMIWSQGFGLIDMKSENSI